MRGLKSQLEELSSRLKAPVDRDCLDGEHASESDLAGGVQAWRHSETCIGGTMNSECAHGDLAYNLANCDTRYGFYLSFLRWRRNDQDPQNL